MEAPLNVFISYAHEDEEIKDRLEKHLTTLKKQKKIQIWQDRLISAGNEWDPQIKKALKSADIILLLISVDFMASDYINRVELKQAIQRHESGQTRVIPIILDWVDLEGEKIAELQSLPKDAKPLTEYENPNKALSSVAKTIRLIVASLNEERARKKEIFPKKSKKLSEEELYNLFIYLADIEAAYKQIIFPRAFKATFNHSLKDIRPDCDIYEEPALIEELLICYRNPQLTLRFVELLIQELQRHDDAEADYTDLVQWFDEVAKRFKIAPLISTETPTAPSTNRHAFLLIILEVIGVDVNVFPELHVTGVENPINFGAHPVTIEIDQVTEQISQWIELAENTIDDDCDDEEITLEIFLPCQYLEANIAKDWFIKNPRGTEISLGFHRRLLIRSWERIKDKKLQKTLKRKWEKLEACVKNNKAYIDFHLQKVCPEGNGILLGLLKNCKATGLKYVAQLPTDSSQRKELLYEIIDSAVPIALWSSETKVVDSTVLMNTFDSLLENCNLTNFATIARQLQSQRLESNFDTQIRLLCDRPDRLPTLPDLEGQEDENAIVAS